MLVVDVTPPPLRVAVPQDRGGLRVLAHPSASGLRESGVEISLVDVPRPVARAAEVQSVTCRARVRHRSDEAVAVANRVGNTRLHRLTIASFVGSWALETLAASRALTQGLIDGVLRRVPRIRRG